MKLRAPLSAKLAVIALLFFIGGAAFHAISYQRLDRLSVVSSEVRNRWLDTIRVLGRMYGHVAILRIDEAEALSPGGRGASGDMRARVDAVEKDIQDYQELPHDADEQARFANVLTLWAAHRRDVDQMTALDQQHDVDELGRLYRSESHARFQALASSLRALIDMTNTKADAARSGLAKAMDQTIRLVGDLFIGTMLLFACLALYVWTFYSKPLLTLAALMRRLANTDSKFDAPFTRRTDEVGDVARSLAIFRDNTIELLESRKALAASSRALEGMLEKERALAVHQRNFIQTMSHELRTPLTYIDGHAQRLLATKDKVTASQLSERAQKIRLAGLQITRLIESLTGAMDILEREQVMDVLRIDALLADIAERQREIVECAVGCELELTPGLTVRGDRELLRFAFSNLVVNAFKYSSGQGDIRITGRLDKDCVEIAVEDHGMGIAEGEIARVREPYYRASNAQSLPGTGMGLYLAERIVQQHGGFLKIESDIGRGTRVIVTLPAASLASSELESPDGQHIGHRRRHGSREPAAGGARRTRVSG